MQVDKTTLADLSVFNADEEQSLLSHLNFAATINGKEFLRQLLKQPKGNITEIKNAQNIIKSLIGFLPQWPETISNGTLMVIEKFYDSSIESLPQNPGAVNAWYYKVINSSDFSLTRYSVTHFISFLQGMNQLSQLLSSSDSATIKTWQQRIAMLMQKPAVQNMLGFKKDAVIEPGKILSTGYFVRHKFKAEIFELIDIYSRLDAYLSLAIACKKYGYIFPEFIESDKPHITAEGLYHPLLSTPVAYNIGLTQQKNFLFLTGANMAGKSTFIKAVGVSAYLAHLGMGVPAKAMQLCVFAGLLSNINVADNIVKGESYFFNEVQRIKATVEKINDGKKWLILIDELFKGTNVQDAMKCSITVIEGLQKLQNAAFILSTHLYEIGDSLRPYPNIQFKYFETAVNNGQLVFNYKLLDGISNDRLGYLILQREGVVDMLENLG